jgi:ribonuclease R
MTSLRYPPQAIALSKSLTLQDYLWQRPQVQGFTIDGPTSLDLDDAIWIEPTETGAILSVHIADVTELVTPGSVLDKVAIAPDRETMYQTLLTLGSGVAIRQRLASWLNRADYGPALIGHFALNLPAYCHFTSPIRRLADLINHRIVKAQLRGQDLPYSKTELEQLGQHIDQVTRDLEQKTSDFFKGKHQEQYKAQVQSSEDLQALSEKEFSRVLKYAIESQELEAIAPELKTRLKSRKLQLLDLYFLLFQSNNETLQQQAYGCLKENVQDAASIISMAIAQQEDWESFEYIELSQGQTSPFYSWLEVRVDNKVLTTVHPSEHQRKQSARHQACLSWIEAYLQDGLVSPEQRIKLELLEPKAMVQPVEVSGAEMKAPHPESATAESKPKLAHRNLSKPLKDGQPFASLLLEVSQRLRLPGPDFEFHEAEGYFICKCRFEGLNQRFVGEGAATKKQRAKHLAARNVLEKLQGLTAQKGGEWEAGA